LIKHFHEFLQTPELSAGARREQTPDWLRAAACSAAINCCLTAASLNGVLRMGLQLSIGESVAQWCVQQLETLPLPAPREPERAGLWTRLDARKEQLEQLNPLSLQLLAIAYGMKLRTFWSLGREYLAEAKRLLEEGQRPDETSACEDTLNWAGRLCDTFAEAGLDEIFPPGMREVTPDVFAWLIPMERRRAYASSFVWWRGLLLESQELPSVGTADERVNRLMCECMIRRVGPANTPPDSPPTHAHPDGPAGCRSFWYKGQLEILPSAQYKLLECLWPAGKEPRQRVPVRELVIRLWPNQDEPGDLTRALAVRLSRLRRALRTLQVPWTYTVMRGGWDAEVVMTRPKEFGRKASQGST
jgi:hypothetical protein